MTRASAQLLTALAWPAGRPTHGRGGAAAAAGEIWRLGSDLPDVANLRKAVGARGHWSAITVSTLGGTAPSEIAGSYRAAVAGLAAARAFSLDSLGG